MKRRPRAETELGILGRETAAVDAHSPVLAGGGVLRKKEEERLISNKNKILQRIKFIMTVQCWT